ncbi:hypothetical protein L1887_11534 [Cichorium endivia]|nr:hypothetical protein L1887_11534 [Cichorium endivia]
MVFKLPMLLPSSSSGVPTTTSTNRNAHNLVTCAYQCKLHTSCFIITTTWTKIIMGQGLSVEIDDSSTQSHCKLEIKPWERWTDWFKRLELGDKIDLRYEWTVWLKILGLPLKLWDKDKFTTICSNFGRVIHPFDGISSRRDLSMEKVVILTSARKWINEELQVTAGGWMYKIGVVEYTDDWCLFTPLPFGKTVESDSEDEDENSEGVFDTWMEEEKDEDSEKEDGEFFPEDYQEMGEHDDLVNCPVGGAQSEENLTGDRNDVEAEQDPMESGGDTEVESLPTGATQATSSQSNEIEATVGIRAEIGFHIDPNNEVLVGILGGDGDNIGK